MQYRTTRRDSIALSSAAIAAGAFPALMKAQKALAQPEDDDAAVLEAAIGLEQTAAVAYDTAISRGLVAREIMRTAELFRDQVREHADELIAALEELGHTPRRPPARADVDGVGGLIALETTAVAAYYDAQRTLLDVRLLQTAASIMGNHAQHLVVLRQAIGENPSPDAFVTGSFTVS